MPRSRGILLYMLAQFRVLAGIVSVTLTLTLLYQVLILTWSGQDEPPLNPQQNGYFRRLQYSELLSLNRAQVHPKANTSKSGTLSRPDRDRNSTNSRQTSTEIPHSKPLDVYYATHVNEHHIQPLHVRQDEQTSHMSLPVKVPDTGLINVDTGTRQDQPHTTKEKDTLATTYTATTTSDSAAVVSPRYVVRVISKTTPSTISPTVNSQSFARGSVETRVRDLTSEDDTRTLQEAVNVLLKSAAASDPSSKLPPSDVDVQLNSHPYNQPNQDIANQLTQQLLKRTQQQVVHQPSQEVVQPYRRTRESSLLKQRRRSQSTNLLQLKEQDQLPHSKPPPPDSKKKSPKTKKSKLPFHLPLQSTNLNQSTSNFSIPFMANYKCRNHYCLDLLSPLDKAFYEYCSKKLVCKPGQETELSPARCHFMDGRNRAAVALASFPGSGNTWVRGLLEQATGVCTGAVYCDGSIRRAGYAGEGMRTGAVIAVKTHKGNVQWTDINRPEINEMGSPSYGSAILVIRNPLDALIAEWNREASQKIQDSSQNGSTHVKSVGKDFFGENRGWNIFVKTKIKKWQGHFVSWLLNNDGHPVLIVRFEDLKTDLVKEVRRMLEFLKVPYSEEELTKRMMEDNGTFRRRHHEVFDHFTAEQRSIVLAAIRQLIQLLKLRNGGDTLGMEEYLRSTTT